MPGARDGQLRVRRGDDTPPWTLQMFDDDLGLWLTLAQADVEEDAMRVGIPVLRGPYVINFTDIPHDGDIAALWTPASGDVLLRLFPDWQTVIQWDCGQLNIGQNLVAGSNHNTWSFANVGSIGRGSPSGLDNITDAVGENPQDSTGALVAATAQVFTSADPVQIMLINPGGGPDPTQGHVEIYTLVARAVAP